MRWMLLSMLVLAAGCDEGSGSIDAGGDGGRRGRDASRPDAGPVLDPSLFDCTSSSAGDGGAGPLRASPIPIACALDPSCRTVQVSAHRGAGGQLGVVAPENTLAAFRAGILLGVEYLETDPRPTADEVIVNMHDTTVDRTTDGSGTVSEMSFAEVRALHVETTLAGDFSCERVPTLQEILELARGRAVVLVDANKTDRVDLLVQAILDADAIEWAIFDTSSVDKIDRALAIEPGLQFMIRPRAVDEITPQLDHFAPLLPTIVELDLTTAIDGARIVHERGSRVFSDVFAADLLFNMTGNDSGYATALDRGVDILQSDRPDAVIAVLRQRGAR